MKLVLTFIRLPAPLVKIYIFAPKNSDFGYWYAIWFWFTIQARTRCYCFISHIPWSTYFRDQRNHPHPYRHKTKYIANLFCIKYILIGFYTGYSLLSTIDSQNSSGIVWFIDFEFSRNHFWGINFHAF